MPLLRTVKCDICGETLTEPSYGAGFADWMLINGIVLDGNDQIWLCPEHRNAVADYIDSLKHGGHD